MTLKSMKPEDPAAIDELWNFFNHSAVVFCIVGRDGFFKHINSAFIRMLGFSREEFLTTPILGFVHTNDKPIAVQNFKLIDAGRNSSFSIRCLTKKGSYKWLHWSVTNVRGHEFLYASAQDYTDIYEKTNRLSETLQNAEKNNPGPASSKSLLLEGDFKNLIIEKLAAAKLCTQSALQDGNVNAKLVTDATGIINEIISSINEKIVGIDNDSNFDLAKTIEDYAGEIRSTKKLMIDCTFRLKPVEKSGGAQYIMPDIIKEYVDDVVEHYQPKNIDITLIQSFGKLELMIVDDGVQINGQLNNEEARLSLIMPKIISHHGEASLDIEEDKSFLLQVSLPLNA